MSSIQRFVLPQFPTTLVKDTHVDLPGYDVWLPYTHGVFTVPTKIDAPKFEDALSRTLQIYPHAAGRLRCSDERWSIELTNSAVPVEIVNKPGMSPDSLLDGDWIVQSDISPFLSHQPACANLVNGDVPLLRFKLTFFHHETSICISWNHSLGDGVVIFRFMRTLSQFYQGLPHEFAMPIFKKYHFPSPSHSAVTDFISRLPLALTDGSNDTVSDGTGYVRWRIDARDLEDLRSALSSNNGKSPSKQDCLIAYLVAVLNYNRANPVKWVTNVSSYRHIHAPFIDENVTGNLLLAVSADVPIDMTGIATAIRNSRIQSQDPQYIYTTETLKSKLMLDAANAGESLPYQPNDSGLIVNSHTSINWTSAHFGCPDGTRFNSGGLGRNCLICCKPNPVKGDDGVWQDRQSIEIVVGVPAEQKPKILEILARGVQYVLNNERARL